MSDKPRDAGSGRVNHPGQFESSYLPDRQAMLAALRVVLGLPRVILASSPDDLLSDGS